MQLSTANLAAVQDGFGNWASTISLSAHWQIWFASKRQTQRPRMFPAQHTEGAALHQASSRAIVQSSAPCSLQPCSLHTGSQHNL